MRIWNPRRGLCSRTLAWAGVATPGQGRGTISTPTTCGSHPAWIPILVADLVIVAPRTAIAFWPPLSLFGSYVPRTRAVNRRSVRSDPAERRTTPGGAQFLRFPPIGGGNALDDPPTVSLRGTNATYRHVRRPRPRVRFRPRGHVVRLLPRRRAPLRRPLEGVLAALAHDGELRDAELLRRRARAHVHTVERAAGA